MKEFRFPYREKNHRLAPELYRGGNIIAFTICIKDKESFFTSNDIFAVFEEVLLQELKSKDCLAYVYLFMPNHAHLLLSGNDSNADIKNCVERFKQRTGYWLYKNTKNIRWQKDYYDHILRGNDDLFAQTKYVLNNPVRAGLVNYWKEYPYKGSTIYNFKDWE